jgi:hypothetical protein
LVPFEDQLESGYSPVPYYLAHYLELVDWTGRVIRADKRGAIPKGLEPVLDSMGFDQESWLAGYKLFGHLLFQVIGPVDQFRQAARDN